LATENIRIKYEVDKKQLDQSNKALEKSAKDNDLVQKEVDQTTEKFAKQEKQLSKTNKIFASTGDQLKQLGNRFTIAGRGVGDMSAGLINTAKGAGTASKAMKILKVALASTGIGLLVVAFGSLVSFFTKTQKGSDILSKAMAALGATVSVLIDRASAFGEGIFKAFENPKESIKKLGQIIVDNIVNRFTAVIDLVKIAGVGFQALANRDIDALKNAAVDAQGALIQMTTGISVEQQKAIANGVKGVANEIKEEAKAAADLEARTQALILRETDFIVVKARLNRVIEESRLAAEEEQRANETKAESDKRRAEATQKAIDALNKRSNEEIAIAKEKFDILSAQVALGESLTEDFIAQAKAEAALEEVESQRASALKKLVTGMNRFTDATKESNEATREKIELDEAQSQAMADKDPMEAATGIPAEVMMDGIQQAIDLNQQKNDAIIQSDLIAQGGKLGIAKEGINLVKQVGSENVILQKALALADIGISTAQAVAKATAISPLTFGQPWAGFAIASGIIQATKVAGILPKFREGGYISGNSHDYGGVNIEAEGGEYMARRESVNKYGRSFFESLNNLEIHPDVINGLSGGSSPIIVKSDNSELINEYRNRPINNISISEDGITLRTKRNNSIVQKKVKRYTT
jgi:hypothetical protein